MGIESEEVAKALDPANTPQQLDTRQHANWARLSPMARGIFITFEGPDGSGKTTQMGCLAGWLEASGHEVVTLRQPGGTPLGTAIRSILLDSHSESSLGTISPLAELALMFADRAQAIDRVIEPALQQGSIVLCDRFTDSSEAYQGSGRQLGGSRVLAVHQAICDGLQPDLTILLLPDLRASLSRARGRNQQHVDLHGTDENRFEREGDLFYERIHAGYEAIAAREPERVKTIRDDITIDEIQLKVRTIVQHHLGVVGI